MKYRHISSLLSIVIILLPSLFFAESYKTAPDSLSEPFLIDTSIVIGPDPTDNSEYSAIAFDGVNYMVVWHDDRNGNWDIYGTRVNQSGEILDIMGIMISQGSSVDDKSPDIAFDGVNYLVVWQCSLGIRAARVTPTGQVLDSVSIAITDQGVTPAVASGDSSSLVVWQDTLIWNNNIYGARVDTAGYVLDTVPIGIAVVDTMHCRYPDVSFGAGIFLVSWIDYNHIPSSHYFHMEVKRINQGGSVLDTIPIDINYQHAGYAAMWDPSIAFDGTNFLLMWTYSLMYNYDIFNANTYGAIVDTSGTILTEAFLIWSTAGLSGGCQHTYPSAAFDGEYFLVVWSKQFPADNDDIYGQHVAQDGTLFGGPFIISSAGQKQYMTDIAYGDTNFFVVWSDRRNDTSVEIYGARVSTQSGVIDPNGLVLQGEVMAYAQHDPVVASDGTNYLVVWEDEDNFDIRGRRISHTAQALDSSIIEIATSDNVLLCPKTMFNNNDYVILYKNREADLYGRLWGVRVDTAGSVYVGHMLIGGPDYVADDNLAMTFDGDNFLIVYSKYQPPGSWPPHRVIGGKLVTAQLSILNSFGLPWGDDVFQQEPSVCTNGQDFLLSYRQYGAWGSGIKGYKIDHDGNLVDSEIHIADTGWNIISAFGVDNYLLVWELDGDLKGVRVTPSCSLLNEVVICTASGAQANPAMVFDGEYYWIVWQDRRVGPYWHIYGAKVDTAGTVLEEFPITDQPGNQVTPEIALGPDNQLFITYSGWTGMINGIEMNTMRIWGIVATDLGMEEITSPFEITEPPLSIVPNPFYRRVQIRYHSPADSFDNIKLKIYNAAGQVVREFHKTQSNTDVISLVWDGTDEQGRQLPQGIYFVSFAAGDYSETRKVIFLR